MLNDLAGGVKTADLRDLLLNGGLMIQSTGEFHTVSVIFCCRDDAQKLFEILDELAGPWTRVAQGFDE